MRTLLISLGTSWAIVPEAFHLLPPGPEGFDAVHVLTTVSSKTEEGIREIPAYFQSRFPGVTLTITRVAGFEDLRSEEEHFHFEEILYRWILEKRGPGRPFVCLAGGFKTMSAAMQKAATVLGAEEVFHVLAPHDTNSADLIQNALEEGTIRWIRLGPEPGWPQLAQCTASLYPLLTVSETNGVRVVRAPEDTATHGFRPHLEELLEKSRRLAGAWDQMAALPFHTLATWSAADLAWLNQPVDPLGDMPWIQSLPKIELHCHLGGFATHGPLLQAVRAAAERPDQIKAGVEPALPEGWPLPPGPCDLRQYMALGAATGSTLLHDPGSLRAQVRLLYAHFLEQRIAYAEVRCSPNNYARPTASRSAWAVLEDIRNAFQQCMDEHRDSVTGACPCHVNLIVIATRKHGGDRSDISKHLALAITAAQHLNGDSDQAPTCQVVGVDLAGFENPDTRAALFATDFEAVHRVGLAVTVHAGENDDAEGIWQAVFKLNARRLGHALHLSQSPDLLRAVAERRIALEMCPYANYQIKGFDLPDRTTPGAFPPYPLHDYLTRGVAVTVNTDNPGISAADLGDNLRLAAQLCPALRRMDLLAMLRHALDAAFVSPSRRTRLGAQIAASIPLPPR